MASLLHAFDFLQNSNTLPKSGVCILYGDQRFLMIEVLHQMQRGAGDDEELQVVRFNASQVLWADLIDELDTQSLFMSSGPKLVVLDEADSFISQQRDKLEELAQRKNLTGLLVLMSVKSTAGTKLHRYVNENGLIVDCSLPTSGGGSGKRIDDSKISKWVIARAKQQHGFTLAVDAANLLKELCSNELGRIEQELAKLALSIPAGQSANQEAVRKVVGGWRTETMWTAIDAAVDGDAASSLKMLDKLFRNEELPIALFGQIGWSLRRYVQAYQLLESARLSGTKLDRREAMLKAGFRNYGDELQKAEARMQRLGGAKLQQLGDWLLAADQQLKGSHSQESRGRLVLEKLVFFLADPRRISTRKAAAIV